MVNAFYESDRVEVLQGELTEHVVKSGSGGDHTICRCKECGTALFSYYPRVGRLGAGVRVGSFDDPCAFHSDRGGVRGIQDAVGDATGGRPGVRGIL